MEIQKHKFFFRVVKKNISRKTIANIWKPRESILETREHSAWIKNYESKYEIYDNKRETFDWCNDLEDEGYW